MHIAAIVRFRGAAYTRASVFFGLMTAVALGCSSSEADTPAAARCGDGVAQDGEACDDGNDVEQDFCRSTCQLSTCGDGIVHFVLGEQCDDGNTHDGDGCSSHCVAEVSGSPCGDGVVQAGEACDDGNRSEQDFCRNNCQISRCGDGLVHFVLGEECDDGNTVANDGCSTTCQRERCGDGVVQDDEECDDGNDADSDGCNAHCGHESCGDGIVQNGEVCDDSNAISNDGCDADCRPSEVVAVAPGVEHTCILTRQGSVRCFGEGDSGRLGYTNSNIIGDDEFPSVAGDVQIGGKAVQVGAGFRHTCALFEGGQIRCWGEGVEGQLGYGNTAYIGVTDTPASVGYVPVGGTAVQIAVGWNHTCALLDNGKVRCWGDGSFGQLGYGQTNDVGDNETPASVGDVNLGGIAKAITAGERHTCALLDNGKVRCWGDGEYGRLGYGSETRIGDDETPASVGDVNVGGSAIAVQAGAEHTCALLSSGKVRCWGNNSDGQSGHTGGSNIGDNETPASAGDIDVGGTVTAIAAGGHHTCALLASGAVRCFGEGRYGQLGYANGDSVGNNETLATLANVFVGGPVIKIAGGFNHTCALLATKTVRCWGYGQSGQLGYGDTGMVGDNESPVSAGDVRVF